ncbi:unnamed protein product, partial [Ectocarpus sp. 12 AP-2014]
GTISDINFQAYAGFDMTGYLEWGVDGGSKTQRILHTPTRYTTVGMKPPTPGT